MNPGSVRWQCLKCRNGFVWSGAQGVAVDEAPTFCPHCRETIELYSQTTIDAVLSAYDVPPEYARFRRATTDARRAFWDSIRESYPEIKTFTIDPQADYRYTQAVHEIVEQLLRQNTTPDDRSAA